MTNQEILLQELGEVDEELIPEISYDEAKHQGDFLRKCQYVARVCAAGIVLAVMAWGMLYFSHGSVDDGEDARGGSASGSASSGGSANGNATNGGYASGNAGQDIIIWEGKETNALIDQDLPTKEAKDYMEDATLVQELTDFMKFYMEKPVLDSFTQQDNAQVAEFAAYKMAFEGDERMQYDAEEKRYATGIEDLEEYIAEHFYLENEITYPTDIYKGRDKVTILETFKPYGGVPVIDTIEKEKYCYVVTGHIDGVDENGSSGKPDGIMDGGPVITSFHAVIQCGADDTKKMYEFTRNLG